MFNFSPHRNALLLTSAAAATALLTGCTDPETTGTTVESTTPITNATSAETAESTEVVKPQGRPVGTATMEVTGDSGPVTIRYSLNGGAEQTETVVTLPWRKEFPVYEEISSFVSAEGASSCSITMGQMLLSYKYEADPTCKFSYYTS